MALSLGVHSGQILQIGNARVVVASVGPGEQMCLVVGSNETTFNVSTQSRVEILPKVYVSMGRNTNNNPSPRLCFEADKSIPITRIN